LHLSRAAFYARVKKAERVIRADLDDPDIRLSLHLAILAMELAPRERDPGINIRRAGAQRPGDQHPAGRSAATRGSTQPVEYRCGRPRLLHAAQRFAGERFV